MSDKIPRDMKRAVDRSPNGSVYIENDALTPFPDLIDVGAIFVGVRDDIARTVKKEPEDIVLIGVRVFYKIGAESEGLAHYYAIGSRASYDPEFEHILQEIDQ
jgi:hypothetical protein